ncbi:MAG: glycyl-tRNA synthetase [Patescibacteria group bacterium]|nr:glycyl-tRNA synthetase [Patescibacteria group bacterium]
MYDYGHYGTLLFNNVKQAWWKAMVQERLDVVGVDTAIFMHPTTWKASGHVDGFDDPQIDCRKCKSRFRADHVLESFSVNADKQSIEWINTELDKLRADKKLVCPNCSSADLTPARRFSLMVKSNLGSPVDELSEENVVYLRPETCGGIYLEYKNTIDTLHPKLPFGIAQIGKAFRNEIVAKQFVFRTREFEQMEMQYFHHPSQTKEIFEKWQKDRWAFYLEYGIPETKLHWYKHEKLAHYASEAYDIEYNYAMLGGFKELEGVHARGDWDLSQHGKFSGIDLSYFDEVTRERFIPHIVETSVGVARTVLAFIDSAYTEEEVEGETRVVLKLDKRLSPVKVAILPLSKKEELTKPAKDLFAVLSKKMFVEYDETQSIGKRYRRQDEIGTPFCVTVDFDTLTDNAVTVRDRDTMKQERIPVDTLTEYLEKKLSV